MQEVQVDPVGFETAQAALAGQDGAVAGSVVRVNLADQEHLVTASPNCLADEFLGEALSIHFSGVNECCTEIKAEPKFADETEVIIGADPMIQYEHVVAAMDAVRTDGKQSLFPKVLLSAGIR